MSTPLAEIRQKEARSSVALQIDQRFVDHAKNILGLAPIDDSTKADLWDHFHDSISSADLAGRLASFPVSNELKHQLFTAKKLNDPEPTHTDNVIAAIIQMSKMDAATLKLCEEHPNVLRALTSVKE